MWVQPVHYIGVYRKMCLVENYQKDPCETRKDTQTNICTKKNKKAKVVKWKKEEAKWSFQKIVSSNSESKYWMTEMPGNTA